MTDYRASCISVESADAEVNAIVALADGGKVQIYGGQKPKRCTGPVGVSPLLVECGLVSPAFGRSKNAVALANPIEPGRALAKGRATWFRVVKIDGSPVWDGTVGPEADPQKDLYDLYLNSVEIQSNAIVRIFTSPSLPSLAVSTI